MIILTAYGSFADAFIAKYKAMVASSRELERNDYIQTISQSKVIIHNASTIKPSSLDTYISNNFDSTRFIIQSSEKINTSVHIIILSSMSILDVKNSRLYADVSEMTPYAYSKYLSETYSLKSELNHISCVRFSTIFYMNPEKDGLSKLIYDAVKTKHVTIYNNGEAHRDFIPLEIAVDYIQKISLNPLLEKTTYTLCSGVTTSFKEILDILIEHIPELVVSNIDMDHMPSVLSKFHTDDIEKLGQINFVLKNYIVKYIHELQQ